MPEMPHTCCAAAKVDPVAVRQTPLQVTLVGHPFSPLGTGRALRVVFAACRSVGIETAVRDVWGLNAPEMAQAPVILPSITTTYGGVNIFHLNGDEVEPVLERIGPLPEAYNIVVPFWELPRFPTEWARQLERFDEIWAASDYIRNSLVAAVERTVVHMPLATEIELDAFRGRRYFGIPEDSYAFLFFFDCRSRLTRKNPQAVAECFRRLLEARPWARTCLVMKLHGFEVAPTEVQDFLADLRDRDRQVVVLAETMSEVETHNLIHCCDAFVSLHRSEGFGLGLAEAMYLGLPVIGTGYSGNMDFMTPDNSIPVGYRLVLVPSGAYPHADDQHWAEPDLNEAAVRMIGLLDNPAAGRELGRKASLTIRTKFSYRVCGLRYAQRLSRLSSATREQRLAPAN